MNREFEQVLIKRKDNGMEKPLVVIEARQIGKTYSIEHFCHNHFENVISVNLEKDMR